MVSPVEHIKEKLSIVDVVSSYVKLEKAGSNFRARCPFHNEKSPSFFVSPVRGSYHCFGCSRGGDIFSFVEEIEGIDFSGALKILAEKAGVQLGGNSNFKERNERTVLFQILEEATLYYEKVLAERKDIEKYLLDRGLTKETIKNFRVGYAPDAWSALYTQLHTKRFSDADIEKAGLLISGTKGFYDRFRSRIMFPIADSQGRVVAFSGRIFPVPENSATPVAKYVNSPETVLYNKSEILFGYDKAKRAMMKENRAVLVEGQMDLLMAHQAGTAETVASSGTALTAQHLKLISRFTDVVILAFDSDNAGFQAAKRGAALALSAGMDVTIAALPKGLDPADAIKKDISIWKNALLEKKHIISYILALLQEKTPDVRALSREVSKEVLPLVAALESKIDQAYFVREIADKLRVAEEVVREELTAWTKRNTAEQAKYTTPQKEFVQPEVKKTMAETIKNSLLGIILWQEKASPPSLDIPLAIKRFEKVAGVDFKKVTDEISVSARENFILQAEMSFTDSKKLSAEVSELLLNLEKEILEEKLSDSMVKLKQAEASNNIEESTRFLKECQELSKRIHEIKSSRFS